MLEHIDNLKLVSVIKGVTNPTAVHTQYPHRLILRLTGTVRYHVAGQTPVLGPGDVLFLPNSPTYRSEVLPPETCTYILVNFEGNLPNVKPRPYILYGQAELHSLFTQLYRSWTVQTPANRCRCMALLYELLAHFADSGRENAETSTTYSKIEPALEYLKMHMFEPSLKIRGLHTLCSISDTYFRKIFISRFGISPKKYVTNLRLTQAKAIIDSGEFSSIYEVAAMTGFDDALYFSKVFKAKYGYPPSANG